MRFRAFAAAALAVLTGLLVSASARADGGTLTNYTTRCSASHNACETVANLYKGSDYVLSVRVWDEHSSDRHTMRVLFDQSARASLTWDVEYPGLLAYFYYNVRPGMCIQGGIEGVSDGRTPCWVAP